MTIHPHPLENRTMSAKLASTAVVQDDCRAVERHHCEVPTTCQPPSAWRKDPWPATIRNISTGGMCLSLNRRFERGSGLAIELPADDGTTSTVLARVKYVNSDPDGGWLLGCSFISELSDEEVEQVLVNDPLHQSTTGDTALVSPVPLIISGVLFQARTSTGEPLRWFVKRLDLSVSWPLPVGKTVALSVGISGARVAPIPMRVRECRVFGSCWVVECDFTSPAIEAAFQTLLGDRVPVSTPICRNARAS
jgi:hypothetical protein